MRIVIIVQARMSSTRLPGKVLKKIMGKPLLEYQLERLRRVESADDLIVATTINKADDRLVEFCRQHDIACFRGSEEDVLERYYLAGQQFGADAIVRVTSDCPLIDPTVIDQVIRTFVESEPQFDYVANTLERTYPRGMDCEAVSAVALERAHRLATDPPDREHVTRYFYRQPDQFKLGSVTYLTDASAHRWTVDTPEDFELIKRILEALYPEKPGFTLEDCLVLLKENLDWSDLNRHVEQKK